MLKSYNKPFIITRIRGLSKRLLLPSVGFCDGCPKGQYKAHSVFSIHDNALSCLTVSDSTMRASEYLCKCDSTKLSYSAFSHALKTALQQSSLSPYPSKQPFSLEFPEIHVDLSLGSLTLTVLYESLHNVCPCNE